MRRRFLNTESRLIAAVKGRKKKSAIQRAMKKKAEESVVVETVFENRRIVLINGEVNLGEE